jgi:transcriptional regulator with XRE-family HTH domain
MGDFLRRLRADAHLSQRELALRLNCHQPAIARLEAGGVMPDLTTLMRIAEALGLSCQIQMVRPDQLLDEVVAISVSRSK